MLYLSDADWSVTMRRVPEAMTAWLVPGGVLTLLVGLGAHTLYQWSHPEAVAQDALLSHKAPFLNLPLFFALTGAAWSRGGVRARHDGRLAPPGRGGRASPSPGGTAPSRPPSSWSSPSP